MGLREWVVQEYKSSHRRARGRTRGGPRPTQLGWLGLG